MTTLSIVVGVAALLASTYLVWLYWRQCMISEVAGPPRWWK